MANSATFWFSTWLGTAAAGGLFGLVVGGGMEPLAGAVVGLMFGTAYASVWAVPIISTVAVVTWAAWISRFRIGLAFVGGALTGVVATWYFLYLPAPPSLSSQLIVWAGVVGGIGGGLAAKIHDTRIAPLDRFSSRGDGLAWQFTLRDLFLRMTVLAMLLAVWTWIIRFLDSNFFHGQAL